MDNYLDTGGVLPSGLLSGNDTASKIAGFNKTYKNYPLRLGIIGNTYPISDDNNFTKLSTEYDVLVFEQNEDRGSTILTYKNCIASDSLGSVADFLDKNFRAMTQNTNPGGLLNTANQNGSTVLLLCLDGVSEKAVIIGALPHPDRECTLASSDPYLEGEYNGVNIKVNTDGSTALTFNGATDSQGVPTDPSQGPTQFQIKTDGSFEFSHSAITITADKSGVLTISTKSDANVTIGGNTNLTTTGNTSIVTSGNANITTTGTADIIAQGTTTVDGSTIKLGQSAVESVIKGNMFASIYNTHFHVGNLGVPTGPPATPMDPSLSKHTFTE